MSNDSSLQVPFSEEAERAVIGSVLLNPKCFAEAAQIIDNSNSFYFVRHQMIWEAIERAKRTNNNFDHLVIAEILDDMGKLDDIGGRAYLVKAVNETPTSIYVSVYAELVRRTAERREWMIVSDKIKGLAMDTSVDIDTARQEADNLWLSATGSSVVMSGESMQDIISRVYDQFESLLGDGTESVGIQTGITSLDKLILGLEKDQLMLLAGRPGMGKSAACYTIALDVARRGHKVAMFITEMSKDEASLRFLSMMTGISVADLKTPSRLPPSVMSGVTSAFGELSDLPIWIDDNSSPRPRDIHATMKFMAERFGYELAIVDGIWEMEPDQFLETQNLRVGSIANGLRNMARDLHIPVLATQQLSRKVEDRQDKRPVMSDLRDSGSLEQVAHKVVFLYRDEVYNAATEFANQADFIVAKHRNGTTGTASAYWDGNRMTFKNASKRRVDLSDMG